jgi:broad specificity phosphatase PhoE
MKTKHNRNKIKTRKIKGGLGFYSDPQKRCIDNKKDWENRWQPRGYKYYNPSTLYPGGYNLYDSLPMENGLQDKDGTPRTCYDSPNKDCSANIHDWETFWKDKTNKKGEKPYQKYNPTTLYESNKYTLPLLNGLKDDKGNPKVCNDPRELDTKNIKQYLNPLYSTTVNIRKQPNYTPRGHDLRPKTIKTYTYESNEPLYESEEEEKENEQQQQEQEEINKMKRSQMIERIQATKQDELQQVDGLEEISSIIVSHNTRIQCLLDAIHQTKDKNKIRFMNCAVLKLTVTPTQLYLSMVYEGDLAEKEYGKISTERPYYVKELSNPPLPGHIVYPTTTYNQDTYNFNQYLKLPVIDKKYTFFIVRHGQAQHNDSSDVMANKLHSVTDTSLTPTGKLQAELAGRELYQYLTKNAQTIPTHFFVSDLVRTHETLANLIYSMRKDPTSPPLITLTRKPVVLPCAHELPIKGIGGNCDQATADAELYSKLASENYSKCSVNSDGTLNATCNPDVDWTMYLPFYGGKVRGQKDTVTGRIETQIYPLDKQNCRNTTMIALALSYLTVPEFKEKHVEQTVGNEDLSHLSYEEQQKDKQPLPPSVFGGKRKTRKLKLKRNKK